MPSAWQAALFALIAFAVVLQLLLLTGARELIFSQAPKPPLTAAVPDDQPVASQSQPKAWQYVSDRDSRNPALSDSQCEAAFPQLWFEIDRAVTYWRDTRKHVLLPADTNITWCRDACTRALIYENELRILETKGTYQAVHNRKRTQAILSQIHRALLGATANGENIPNIEFSFSASDYPPLPEDEHDNHTVWTFARKMNNKKQEKVWIMPDFNYWAWSPFMGSFHDMQNRAKAYDAPIEQKIPKVIWRGAVKTNPDLRGALIEAAKGQTWSDVEAFHWKSRDNYVRAEDMCRYMFVVHTEGHSWSGRLKYLLNCDSLPIIHDFEWTAATYHLLKAEGEEQNYIPVRRDFSDLEGKVEWFLRHPEEAQRVVQNSVSTFRERYSTPAAEACYWRRLFHAWRGASFEPDPFEEVDVEVSGVKETQKQLRGLSYELWLGFEGNWPSDDIHSKDYRPHLKDDHHD